MPTMPSPDPWATVPDAAKPRMVDTSTMHIAEATLAWFDQGRGYPVLASTSYGWLLAADDDFDHLPDDLRAVLTWAKAKGAGYVWLDADGYQHSDLPIHYTDAIAQPWDVLRAAEEDRT